MYEANILSPVEGNDLLILVRRALESAVRHENYQVENHNPKLDEIHGVICTLLLHGEVLGQSAIGLPYPLLPVAEAAASAAITASHENGLLPSDLAELKIELSILTLPVKVEAVGEKIASNIGMSEGLVMKYSVYESFLPPQSSYNTKEEFLDALCEQAGISKGMWKEPGIELFKFNAQVFKEN